MALAALLPRCDNGATGEEACRSIEEQRCASVQGCPASTVVSDGDVTNCQLFYRDECLYGMADSLDPSADTTNACVAAIAGARACSDANLLLGPCNTPGSPVGGPALSPGTSAAATGCDAVMHPELLQACVFLAAVPPVADAGSGGTGGSDTGSDGG